MTGPRGAAATPTADGVAGAVPGGPGRTALPALDGLRAVAVGAVLLTHVGFQTGRTDDGQLGALLARLDVGVTVFFLLSGFLLYRPFAVAHLEGRSGPPVRDFLRNRALRVLPAYVVLVLVVVPLLSPDRAGAVELLRQALLLQTVQVGHLLPGLTQTWSLVVEVGFYLVLPGLAALARPRRARTADEQLRAEALLLSAMALTALGWQVAVHGAGLGDQRVAGLWLPGYLDWFALGMGLAVLRAWGAATGRDAALRELAGAWPTWLALAGLLLWLSTSPAAGPLGLEPATGWEAVTRHLLYAGVATCLLVPVVLRRGGPAGCWEQVLSSRPARHLGQVSYGVFLWHLLALDLVYRLPGLEEFRGRALLVLALVAPLSLAMAELSLRVVEAPALRRKRPAR